MDFVTAQHIELVNVMNSGALVAAPALWGLRRYQKWTWYALLFTALWPGLHDAWAVIAHTNRLFHWWARLSRSLVCYWRGGLSSPARQATRLHQGS